MNRNAKLMQNLAHQHRVEPTSEQNGVIGYTITTTTGSTHQVFRSTTGKLFCDCQFQTRYPGHLCSHALAVLVYRAQQQGYRLAFWSTETAARRQHQPYRQLGSDLWLTYRRAFPLRYHSALTAIAQGDRQALEQWLARYAPQYLNGGQHSLDNAVYYTASAASSAPYDPANTPHAVLRRIAADHIDPEGAARLASLTLQGWS